MGCVTGRCLLVVVCTVQLVAVLERLVFDFLGYMWTPIIFDFLQIVFAIVGLFGSWQYRPKAVICYAVWCIMWLGWNTFIICFYLEVGILKRDGPALSLGTGNKSWWLHHGYGCQRVTNSSCDDALSRSAAGPQSSPAKDACILDCLLQYYYIEVVHAAIQCILAITGFASAFYVIYIFTEEDDAFDFIGGFNSLPPTTPTQSKLSHLQLQPVYVTAGTR